MVWRWRDYALALAACFGVALIGAAGSAWADDEDPNVAPLMGEFIGIANAVDIDTGEVEERDLTIELKPYSRGGLTVEWETIIKVDGRRDVPGVKRRHSRLILEPADRGPYYIEVPQASPFRKKKEVDPLGGDAVRWGTADGSTLKVYSVTVRDDGHFELEIYSRTRTETGIGITFQRLVDGEVVRRVTGRAVAAE